MGFGIMFASLELPRMKSYVSGSARLEYPRRGPALAPCSEREVHVVRSYLVVPYICAPLVLTSHIVYDGYGWYLSAFTASASCARTSFCGVRSRVSCNAATANATRRSPLGVCVLVSAYH